MGLEKLKIVPLNANLKPKGKGKEIFAMYNPKEFTIDTSTQFQRMTMPGLQTPITQFVSGQTQTISLDLFFDTYEKKQDVRDFTRKVTDLLKIDSDIHAPPVCQFIWGAAGSLDGNKAGVLKGVFDKVTQKFTMFLDSGIPVRATLSVSISEYRTLDEQLPRINFKSSDRTKRRIFKDGDRVSLLAHNEYGNVSDWRVIADANDMENPRLIAPGTEVVLPPLE
ncbi:MAG: peptidoglycan-binding protein [bacterium]